jgi:hypothetical protein
VKPKRLYVSARPIQGRGLRGSIFRALSKYSIAALRSVTVSRSSATRPLRQSSSTSPEACVFLAKRRSSAGVSSSCRASTILRDTSSCMAKTSSSVVSTLVDHSGRPSATSMSCTLTRSREPARWNVPATTASTPRSRPASTGSWSS